MLENDLTVGGGNFISNLDLGLTNFIPERLSPFIPDFGAERREGEKDYEPDWTNCCKILVICRIHHIFLWRWRFWGPQGGERKEEDDAVKPTA